MSASTERKNRMAARADGTDKKSIAAMKEEKKKKKEKIRWYVTGILLVIVVALVIYLNSGAFYRNLNGYTVEYPANEEYSIEAGSHSFSVAEVNYLYNMQYVNMVNTYGNYISMLGLDTTQPLDQQPCTISENEDEDYTWHDYFMDSATSQLKSLVAFEAYAEANDITIDKEAEASIDETIDSITSTAKENNYPSANKFLAANYGEGCNTDVVRSIMKLQLIANAVQQSISDTFEYTDAQLKDKYAEVKDDYDTFTYSFYLVEAATETDENGEAAAPTEEALAAAAKTANDILGKLNDETDIGAAAAQVVDGAEATEQTAVAGSSIEAGISEWLKSADRAAGDTAVVEAETGAYVVKFEARDNGQHTTEESGDMNYCDFVADKLLRSDDLNKWGESVFAGILEQFTDSKPFGARYIGR